MSVIHIIGLFIAVPLSTFILGIMGYVVTRAATVAYYRSKLDYYRDLKKLTGDNT